nr:MAG TPA: hypothetical protein [Caudoviricetes sp.]
MVNFILCKSSLYFSNRSYYLMEKKYLLIKVKIRRNEKKYFRYFL